MNPTRAGLRAANSAPPHIIAAQSEASARVTKIHQLDMPPIKEPIQFQPLVEMTSEPAPQLILIKNQIIGEIHHWGELGWISQP